MSIFASYPNVRIRQRLNPSISCNHLGQKLLVRGCVHFFRAEPPNPCTNMMSTEGKLVESILAGWTSCRPTSSFSSQPPSFTASGGTLLVDGISLVTRSCPSITRSTNSAKVFETTSRSFDDALSNLTMFRWSASKGIAISLENSKTAEDFPTRSYLLVCEIGKYILQGMVVV